MISILINYANYFISLSRVLIIILKKEKALRRLIEKGMDSFIFLIKFVNLRSMLQCKLIKGRLINIKITLRVTSIEESKKI